MKVREWLVMTILGKMVYLETLYWKNYHRLKETGQKTFPLKW